VVSCCCAGLRDIGVQISRVAAMRLGDVVYKVYVLVVCAVVRLAEDLQTWGVSEVGDWLLKKGIANQL